MKSIEEIKRILALTNEENFEQVASEYTADLRQGVQKLLERRRRELRKLSDERVRVKKMIDFDSQFSLEPLAGVDEVGRGPLAGPVVAACVIMDKAKPILEINDSKKLSIAKREQLYSQILENSLYCAIGEVEAQIIDEKNILQSTFLAMNSSINHVKKQMPGSQSIRILLVDGNQKIPYQTIPQMTVVKGDAQSYSIACASILAKVYRDRLMARMDERYPGYDFASNVGYGTAFHIQAIKEKGLSPIHRKSFCKNLF